MTLSLPQTSRNVKSIEWQADNQIELSDSRDSDLCEYS